MFGKIARLVSVSLLCSTLFHQPKWTASEAQATQASRVGGFPGPIGAPGRADEPPSITLQPQSQTACAGSSVKFQVQASGTGPLGYQWRKNGANVLGATAFELSLSNLQVNSVGGYSVVITNSVGAATSQIAALTINLPPAITQQPQSQTVPLGASVTFTASASGTTPLSYRWMKNDTTIAGATGPTLVLNNVQSSDAGGYAVEISNACLKIRSQTATLIVKNGSTQPETPAHLSITKATDSLLIDYSLRGTNGAFSILFADRIEQLAASAFSLFDGDMAAGRSGRIAFNNPPETGVGFFRLIERAKSEINASLAPIDDGEEFPPDSFATVSLSSFLPEKLVANTSINVAIETIGGVGQRLLLAGTIKLSLATSDGAPAPFDYSISPATLVLADGIATASITIATQANLSDVFLAAEFFQTSPGGIGKAAVVPAVKQVFNYFAPKDQSWIHPLARPSRLTGMYGEWPGHAAIHRGIDVAALPQTVVRAAARGRIGSKSGEWLAILHGNGTATRYGHIVPRADLLVGKSTIEQGEPIGVVRSANHPHLHFESRKNKLAQKCEDNFCGFSENPALTLPVLVEGDTDYPEMTALYFRKTNPAQQPLSADDAIEAAPSGGPFVVLKCLDRDYRGGTTSAELAPARVTFRPETSKSASIVFSDAKTIDSFFQKETTPGYARLSGVTEQEMAQHRYQFWFKWDTAGYADQHLGPRSLDVDVGDAAGNSVARHFEFGPKIQSKTELASVTARTFVIDIQAKLGPLPQAIIQAQAPDRIVLSLDPSGLLRGTASLEGNATWDVRQHNDSQKFSVRLSDTAEGLLKVKATSTAFPDIADEVKIQVQPKDEAASWAGTWTGQHQYSGQGTSCFYSSAGKLVMTITVSGNSFSGPATVAGIQIREVSPLTCKVLGDVTASGTISGTIVGNAISGSFSGNYPSATFGSTQLAAGTWSVTFQGTKTDQTISGTVTEGASRFPGTFSLSK